MVAKRTKFSPPSPMVITSVLVHVFFVILWFRKRFYPVCQKHPLNVLTLYEGTNKRDTQLAFFNKTTYTDFP